MAISINGKVVRSLPEQVSELTKKVNELPSYDKLYRHSFLIHTEIATDSEEVDLYGSYIDDNPNYADTAAEFLNKFPYGITLIQNSNDSYIGKGYCIYKYKLLNNDYIQFNGSDYPDLRDGVTIHPDDDPDADEMTIISFTEEITSVI